MDRPLTPIRGTKTLNVKIIKDKKESDFIPCMYMEYEGDSSKLFLYFHANAEDLGRAYKFLTYVHTCLKMHVLAVEYPGYGTYKEREPSAEKIIRDADTVYAFVTKKIGWREEDIVVCGRSIGSGPACHVASIYKPSALVLVSPHTSIRGVVKDSTFGSIT